MLNDIQRIVTLDLPWEKLKNKTLLISGASGLLGKFLIDVLMAKNKTDNLNCKVVAVCRNEEKARVRLADAFATGAISIFAHDVTQPFDTFSQKVDYILHLASNTHPIAYSTDPIGTITTNILGTKNLLDLAKTVQAERMLLASSVEIYGENRGDVELFDETYCGYINCNTMRAGYPESKRCSEALCQAYIKQAGLDVVIARLARIYGPTMLMEDSKALSQFIKKGIAGEDIVLKSAGSQFYSYVYVADATSALLTILLKGVCGEAYNVADAAGDVTLKELAETIAQVSGTQVKFEMPNAIEQAGYSTATKARLDGSKLKNLDWLMQYDVVSGIRKTIRELSGNGEMS